MPPLANSERQATLRICEDAIERLQKDAEEYLNPYRESGVEERSLAYFHLLTSIREACYSARIIIGK